MINDTNMEEMVKERDGDRKTPDIKLLISSEIITMPLNLFQQDEGRQSAAATVI